MLVMLIGLNLCDNALWLLARAMLSWSRLPETWRGPTKAPLVLTPCAQRALLAIRLECPGSASHSTSCQQAHSASPLAVMVCVLCMVPLVVIALKAFYDW